MNLEILELNDILSDCIINETENITDLKILNIFERVSQRFSERLKDIEDAQEMCSLLNKPKYKPFDNLVCEKIRQKFENTNFLIYGWIPQQALFDFLNEIAQEVSKQ